MENALNQHANQFNQAVSALIELEAMKAENKNRENQGLSPAYGEKDFMNLLDQYDLGYNGCVNKSRNFF